MENSVNNVNLKNSQEMENSNNVNSKNAQKMNKKVTGVAARATIGGLGIVNYDNADMQKDFLEKNKINYINHGRYNDNHKYAKRVFYREVIDGKEVIKSKLKISQECMRRYLLGNNNFTQLDWQKEESLLGRFMNPLEYIRGYMAADSKNWSFNKTSSLYISDAVDKNAIVVPEWCVNGNEIKPKKDDNEKSTSIYIKDKTYKTEYEVIALYKPKFDQFLCLDDDGRIGLPTELCETDEVNTPLAQAFIQKYGRKPYKFGKYVLNSDYLSRYQVGCMFDNEYINFLFRTLINSFKNFEISDRTTGYCKLGKLEIALIYEGEAGIPESEYVWIDIKDFNMDEDIDFYQFFREATDEEIQKIDKKTSKKDTKKK